MLLIFCVQVADAYIALYRQPLSQACFTLINQALGKLKKKKNARIVRPNTLDSSSFIFFSMYSILI